MEVGGRASVRRSTSSRDLVAAGPSTGCAGRPAGPVGGVVDVVGPLGELAGGVVQLQVVHLAGAGRGRAAARGCGGSRPSPRLRLSPVQLQAGRWCRRAWPCCSTTTSRARGGQLLGVGGGGADVAHDAERASSIVVVAWAISVGRPVEQGRQAGLWPVVGHLVDVGHGPADVGSWCRRRRCRTVSIGGPSCGRRWRGSWPACRAAWPSPRRCGAGCWCGSCETICRIVGGGRAQLGQDLGREVRRVADQLGVGRQRPGRPPGCRSSGRSCRSASTGRTGGPSSPSGYRSRQGEADQGCTACGRRRSCRCRRRRPRRCRSSLTMPTLNPPTRTSSPIRSPPRSSVRAKRALRTSSRGRRPTSPP